MTTPAWLERADTFRQSNRTIRAERWGGERLYFQSNDLIFEDCAFEAGESPLKECMNITVERCQFEGKYPLWNTRVAIARDCHFGPGSRAGIWYSEHVTLTACRLDAPKLLRECRHVTLQHCISGDSFETGWNCASIEMRHCSLKGNYLFMHSRDLLVEDCTISGHYAFQYVQRAVLRRCIIDSKDVLWHASDITLEDCEITTEYLAWHAENVTFINCRLRGPQPLCYSEAISLRACSLQDADRCFEYSTVDVDIHGPVDSVLNPAGGRIHADSIGTLLQDDPRVDHSRVRISTTIGTTASSAPDVEDHDETVIGGEN